MTDIVERLGCLLRAEEGSRDHGLPEIVSAMRDAKAEIERLRALYQDVVEKLGERDYEIERLRAALRKIRAGDWGPDECLEDLMREVLDD